MNFRYLTIEDTEINSYVSSRKSYSYICVKSNLKFMFGIGTSFNDYPYIQSTIIKFHRNTKLKTTTYYICKQIESLFTYVPTFGRVYRYIYKPIIEITRSKYEVIDNSYMEQKQELIKEIEISMDRITDSCIHSTDSFYRGYSITGTTYNVNTHRYI